jgi:hypothetical protein
MDELRDILMLTQMANADAKRVTSALVSVDEKTRPKILDPKQVAHGLVAGGGPIPPPPPSLPTLSIGNDALPIPPPIPLIPMPEGIAKPPMVVGNVVPVQQAPTIITPSKNDQQLEFDLMVEKHKEYEKALTWFEEKFKILEQQNTIINSKLNELLTRKRKKYASRNQNLTSS